MKQCINKEQDLAWNAMFHFSILFNFDAERISGAVCFPAAFSTLKGEHASGSSVKAYVSEYTARIL